MPVSRDAHVFERADEEWYQEPMDCTTALLSVEKFGSEIWDPCCGGGNVLRAIIDAQCTAIGNDLIDRPGRPDCMFDAGRDFFQTPSNRFEALDIVCNPPFGGGKLAEAFIRHALSAPIFKLAVFVDVRFLGSARRAEGLWREHPPSRIHMIYPRPSCPPGDYIAGGGKVGGGTADFAWITYDRTHPHMGTTYHWLKRE